MEIFWRSSSRHSVWSVESSVSDGFSLSCLSFHSLMFRLSSVSHVTPTTSFVPNVPHDAACGRQLPVAASITEDVPAVPQHPAAQTPPSFFRSYTFILKCFTHCSLHTLPQFVLFCQIFFFFMLFFLFLWVFCFFVLPFSVFVLFFYFSC